MISVLYPVGEANMLLLQSGNKKKIFRDGDEITIKLCHIGTSIIFSLTAIMTSCTEYFIQCETEDDIYKIYLHGFDVLDINKK